MSSNKPLTVEMVARMCHALNYEYCWQITEPVPQVPWANTSDEIKKSAINGVEFHMLNPDVGPEASHQNWLIGKVDAGWKCGPVKDEVAKTHPCMVLFDNLPAEQQAKDKLFKGVVDAVRELVDYG